MLVTRCPDETRGSLGKVAIISRLQPGEGAGITLAEVSSEAAERGQLFVPGNWWLVRLLIMRPAQGGVVEAIAVRV